MLEAHKGAIVGPPDVSAAAREAVAISGIPIEIGGQEDAETARARVCPSG